MKKALAFFGAFNPPTKAHIDLAELAMKQVDAKEVVFVPSKCGYILEEQNKNFAFSDEERLYMLDKLIEKRPWMSVTNHDIVAEKQPRSYDTLCWLRDNLHCDCSLLIGADQLFNMEEKWLHVPQIAIEFGIVCLARKAFSTNAILQRSFWNEIRQYVTVVETSGNIKWISSSSVRNYITEILDADRLLRKDVPEEIYDYIKENYL